MKIAIKSPSITTMEKGLILHLDFFGKIFKNAHRNYLHGSEKPTDVK
jgi:hypothetical protein